MFMDRPINLLATAVMMSVVIFVRRLSDWVIVREIFCSGSIKVLICKDWAIALGRFFIFSITVWIAML